MYPASYINSHPSVGFWPLRGCLRSSVRSAQILYTPSDLKERGRECSFGADFDCAHYVGKRGGLVFRDRDFKPPSYEISLVVPNLLPTSAY